MQIMTVEKPNLYLRPVKPGTIWLVTDAYYGDGGKGKVVDHLTECETVGAVVRFNGGANAGHTTVINGKTIITHLMPSGIARSNERRLMNVLGRGTVISPTKFLQEIGEIRALGISVTPENLLISRGTHLTLPHYAALENAIENGAGKKGTTKRGVSITYGFKAFYQGVRAGATKDLDHVREQIQVSLAITNAYLESLGIARVSEDEVMAEVITFRDEFTPYLGDEANFLNGILETGGIVLAEGAQSAFLDIDNGNYPHSTSSNTWLGAIQSGAGLDPRDRTRHILVVKAYSTRVGGGNYVTLMDPELDELVRQRGHEFGATTKRPRLCGNPDGVQLNTIKRSGRPDEVAVTKAEILPGIPLKVCTGYQANGSTLHTMPLDAPTLAGCTPIYEDLPGWTTDITGMTEWENLPAEARNYFELLGEMSGAPVTMVGTGPERHQMIIRN